MTVLPVRSMCLAPEGAVTSPGRTPTFTMRPLSTSSVPRSIGAAPPRINLAPSKITTPLFDPTADGGCVDTAVASRSAQTMSRMGFPFRALLPAIARDQIDDLANRAHAWTIAVRVQVARVQKDGG